MANVLLHRGSFTARRCGNVTVDGNRSLFTFCTIVTGGSISVSNSNSNSGWLAGGGIEWAFAPNWTARIEYDFLGLNNSSVTVPVGTPIIGGDVVTVTNRDVQTLTVGVNYLFNWH